jgi:polysaccharide export outer membrane protein
LTLGLVTVTGADPAPVPAPAKAPEAPATLVDRDHRLAPGDRVEIRVEGREEFSRVVRLFHDGTFDYPVLGSIPAAGLTAAQLGERIAAGLQRELRRPLVAVTLLEIYTPPKPPQVTVLGAATLRGVLDLPQPKPLRAVLAQVGPTEKADLSQIRIRYPDGSERRADFSQFSVTGQVKDEILLQGGEEIVLLERPTVQKPDLVRVTVLGAVSRPGTVEIEEGATILDALDKAGSARSSADLARVTVESPSGAGRRDVNVEQYLAGDTAAGCAVHRGDTIVVPEKPLRVYVFGEVVKPGEFPVGANTRVLDVYLQAGITKEADPGRAQLLRRGGDGKPVVHGVNLGEIMKGKEQANAPLQSGDVLFIPAKKSQRGLLDSLNLITGPLWLLRSLAGF